MWARHRENKNDDWTSIIFPRGRIEVARVRRSAGGKPRLLDWDAFVVEAGELEALKRLRSAKRLGDGRSTTLLRHGQYQFLQVESPGVAREELRGAVRWRIKEQVDVPIETAVVDVLEIPAPAAVGAGRAQQIFVVVAGNAQLAPRIHLFQDAKLPLSTIDIPELAQRNVAALFEEENRGLALLAFNDDGGLLTFTYRGELLSSRFIDIKRGELAEARKSEDGLFDRVLLEVQRSLDNFERAHSYTTLSRVLIAPLPGSNGFVDYLKENLYQKLDVLDLTQAVDLSAIPVLADPVRQAEALLAIGAALRNEAPVQ
ncbi:MSHA biogenesis protein MshI [Georgfuchsia toluolica]|uniref:MSHA biogenesis protein MshI n=1 Tax=Georgfuchsia toluolica TaxID=424218 RepID=A0A916J620_9PROT|nr:agglutinin biogenesis protein MshI [Georgfuchsia toluolica]CAG4885204.1 MSHA biogenesis protein MshI [Georgfuchsia toluolica]